MQKKKNAGRNEFASQLENVTEALFQVLAAAAPLGLLLVVLGAGIASYYLEYTYHSSLIESDFALVTASGTGLIRLVLGFLGIQMVRDTRYVEATIIFIVIGILSGYITWHVGNIAQAFGGAEGTYLILSVVWIGLIGELLLLLVKSNASGKLNWPWQKSQETV